MRIACSKAGSSCGKLGSPPSLSSVISSVSVLLTAASAPSDPLASAPFAIATAISAATLARVSRSIRVPPQLAANRRLTSACSEP